MAYPLTTDVLISSARRRAFLPQDGDGSDTTTMLALLNESLGWIQGKIAATRQGHYRRNVAIPLVGGQQDYSLPIRSAGAQSEIVIPIDIQGNPIDQMLVCDDVEWGAMYPPSQTASYPWRYTWMANAIRVYPPPAGAGYSLMFYYLQRISQLVLLASTWQITANLGAGQLSVAPIFTGLTPPTGDFRPNATVNAGQTLWGAAGTVDIVHAQPHFDIPYQGLPIASVTKTLPTMAIQGAGSGVAFGALVFNTVGGITTVPVSGGSSYTTGQAVVVQTGNGQGFTGTLVASGGAASSVTVTNPGTGYCDATQGATAFTLTAPTSDPGLANVVVGDYLCLLDQAPVMTWTMMEAAPVFAQFCAMTLLGERKDPQAYQLAEDKLNKEVAILEGAFMAPRMRKQHNKIITGLGQFRWGARRTRPLGGYLR